MRLETSLNGVSSRTDMQTTRQQDTTEGHEMNEQTPAYTTPKPRGNRKRHGRRGTKHTDARSRELNVLRKRCAQQRRELERLKAIVTVASTSDVENVIIVKTTDGKADE